MMLPGALAAADKAKPNILVLMGDGHRADAIAAFGNGRVRTPNLDRLVKAGTSLMRTYCMGSAQGGVAPSSRAMLLTGQSLYRLGEISKSQDSWPQRFAAAGYRTYTSGAWFHGPKVLRRMFNDGGTLLLQNGNEAKVSLIYDIIGDGALRERRPTSRPLVTQVADDVVTFLNTEKEVGDQPFFCLVSLPTMVETRAAPPEFLASFRREPPPTPANFLPQHPFDNGELLVRDERQLPLPRAEAAVRGALADYYAAISHLDQQIGRILTALDDQGLGGSTIVVFSSDHGLALGSHGLLGKQNLYEHSMRVPLIIAGPGIPSGRRSMAQSYLLDLFPTLADLAHVPAPEGNEGQSLLPVLQGHGAVHRPLIGTAFRQYQRAISDGRWKLIAYPKVPRVQLFDLANDPDERQDLAGESAQAGRLAALGAALVKWQDAFADPLPPIMVPTSP
jgi:arylsulfatase A-like enzyme